MSPKRDVSHERIPQISEAAITVFSRQGFEQSRMEDIGKEAGISKATVYLYFKSKDDLLISLFEDHMEQLNHELRRELGERLPNQGHWFNGGTLTKRFTPAGPDHSVPAPSLESHHLDQTI
mgnify:CR=1 FL=1